MSAISIRSILPESLLSDESQPIKRLEIPKTIDVTRVDFKGERPAPVFEGETPMGFRLCQRDWQYKRHGENRVRTAHRWRLEVFVDKDEAGELQPGNFVVVAQAPYSSQWLQYVRLLKYSKKEQRVRELPADMPEDADPVEWIERNLEVDPWEQSARYVAGVSFPNGFWTSEPRNTSGDLLFGICPDREVVIQKLLDGRKIRDLMEATRKNAVNYVFPKVLNPPPLAQVVIDESDMLMHNAIQQALAGPALFDGWQGRDVADLVGRIFRTHLNNRNRVEYRRLGREMPRDMEKYAHVDLAAPPEAE